MEITREHRKKLLI